MNVLFVLEFPMQCKCCWKCFQPPIAFKNCNYLKDPKWRVKWKNGRDGWQFSCYWQRQIESRNNNIFTESNSDCAEGCQIMAIAYWKIQSVTLCLLPEILVVSCTPSAKLQSSISSSARPAVTTAVLPVGRQGSSPATPQPYPSCTHLGRRQERSTHCSCPGHCYCPWVPAWHTFPKAPLGAGSLPHWHEGHTSDHATRLVLAVVGASRTQQLTPIVNAVPVGSTGLNEQLKDGFSLH